MRCPYGKLTTIRSYGVIPGSEERKDICNAELVNKKQKEEGKKEYNLCPTRDGLGKDIIAAYRAQDEQDQRKRLFLFTYKDTDVFGDNLAGQPDDCLNADARIFVSFTCEQDSEQLLEKHQMTSKISCLGVLMVLVYLTCLHWFKRHSELDQVKWDMLTITPGDYTMQMEITQKMYDYFI